MLREQTRYSRLANITKIINTNLELREVLQHVIKAISEEIVRCNSVGIYLPNSDGTYRGFVGKPHLMNGMTLDSQIIDPEIDLLAKEVIRTKKTIYIPDTAVDSRPDQQVIKSFKIKSLLALPIFFEQELFGLVFLFDYGTPMNLTETEIQSVEAYVNMAAVAIQNANNLAQKEHLLAEKQMLLDVSRQLSECASVQESLHTCFYYIEQVLHSHQMAACLLDPGERRSLSSAMFYQNGNWLSWKDDRIDLSHAFIIKEVIVSKRARYLSDRKSEDGLRHPVFQQSSAGLLFLPLISLGEALGVIIIGKTNETDQNFKDCRIQLAQSIVDKTAPTISHLLYKNQLEHIVKERTRELAAANRRVTSVIESITDGFFTLNRDWAFTYINKHQHLPKNKEAQEVLGKNIWRVFPEMVGSKMYNEFHRAMLERLPVHFEFSSSYEDHWHEVVAYPYDEGICCLFKNITEKKKYEKELKRLSSLDLIGQMAAGISHEIRNPMTTVRGFLQLLTKEDELKHHHHYFRLMIEELDRANSIISEFLSIGNTRTSNLQMLNLNAIIHDMAPLIKVDASSQAKSIHVELQNIPELLLNRNEIRQLIINLCRNGLEAMEAGKVLSIRTYIEQENVVLAIQDEGNGISKEVLEKLGTPFFTTKDNGTGLGLGVCYSIAARHQAAIEVKTGKEGTTFFVKF